MKALLFSLFSLVALATSVISETVHRPRAVNSSAAQFHHRGFHASIIVGDYLFIDGGEVTTWDGTGDGVQVKQPQPDDGNILTQPVNFTYSIDLTTPWTNSTVQLHTISPKAAPVVNQEALWLDADNKTIYVYDGGVSQAPVLWYQSNDIPKNGLWQFTPSGNTGHWSSSYISPSSSFSSLSRVSSGLYAYGNGMGFAVGGRQTDATSYDIFPYITDSILTPGMVIYNISTQEWKNVSITDYSYSGFAVDGAAHFVPSFGPNGLLFVLGGNTGTVENPQPAQFDYVWMYEPGSDKWARQKVSGDVPTERQNQCVVGVQGDEGTYEIFMYGGTINSNVQETVNNGLVWVLSLPSFHWTKQDATPTLGRFQHSCNVVGRQMISVGGVVIESDTTPDAFLVVGGVADPWDNGFGVFDLTDMEWKPLFDPNAGDYVTPDVVKSYYQQNGQYPSWTDSNVKNWFMNPGSEAVSGGSSNSSNDNGGPSSNTGAIAGGVIGGVAVIAIIAGVIWFLMRRKRKEREKHSKQEWPQPQHRADPKYAPVEADADNERPIEIDGTRPVQELPASDRNKPKEPSPGQLHELEGGGVR